MNTQNVSFCSIPDTVEEGYFSQLAESFTSSHAQSGCGLPAKNYESFSSPPGFSLRKPSNGFTSCCRHAGFTGTTMPTQWFMSDGYNQGCESDLITSANFGNDFQRQGVLLDRLKEAHATIEQLLTKISNCGNELVTSRRRKDATEAELAAAKAEIADLTKSQVVKDVLLGRIGELGSEVSSMLQAQEDLLERHVQQEAEVSRLRNELQLTELECQQLRELNKSLRKDQEACKKEFDLSKASQTQMEACQVTAKRERDTLAFENDRLQSEIRAYESKLEELTNSLKMYEKTVSQQEELALVSSKQRQKLEDRIRYLEGGADRTQKSHTDKIARLKQKVHDLESAIRSQGQDHNRLREQLTALQKDKDVLTNDLLQAQREHSSLKVRNEHSERTRNELIIANSSLEDKLQEQLELNMSHERQVKSLNVLIKTETKQNSDLQLRIRELEEQYQYSKGQLEQERDQLRSEIQFLKSESSKENEELTTIFMQQLADKDISLNAVKKELADVVKENDHLQSTVADLELQLKTLALERSGSLAALQELFDDACLRSKALEQNFAAKDQVISHLKEELVAEQSKGKTLDVAYSEACQQLEETKSKLSALSLELDRLEKTNEALKAEVRENLGLVEQLDEEHKKTYREDVKSLTLSIKQWKKELAEKEDALKSLNTEKLELSAKYEAAVENHKKEAECQRAILLQELASIKKQFDNYQSEIDTYKKQNAELNIQVCEYSDKMKGMSDSLEELPSVVREKNALNGKLEQQASELNRVVSERDALLQEKNHLSTTTADLLKKLSVLISNMDRQQEDAAQDRANALMKEQNLAQELRYASDRYTKLSERYKQQRNLEFQSLQKEIDTYKSENSNLSLELAVLRDLNGKLEERQSQLELEKADLLAQVEQMKCDISALKLAFEQLLMDQLEKQKAEFLQREMELVSKLRNHDSAN